jgi:hypothetical protein
VPEFRLDAPPFPANRDAGIDRKTLHVFMR